MIRATCLIAFLATVSQTTLVRTQEPPAKTDAPKPTPSPDVEKALELFKQDKLADALEALKKAKLANPNLSHPKVQIAQWYLQAEKGSNARIFTEQAIAEDNRNADNYLWNGNLAFKEGRITDATLNLDMAILLAEDKRWDAEQKKRILKEARYGLASCFESRGDMPSTREQLLGLLNDDPKNVALRQRLAASLFRMNQVEEARKELMQAFADDPTSDPPELRLALLWQSQASGEADPKKSAEARDRAEEWFKKAVSQYPKNTKCFRDYALWLLEDNKADAAALYAEQALKLDPTNRENQAAKGLYHLYKKDYPAAEAVFETMYRESPGNLFSMANLCLSLVESKDEKKKKRSLELSQALVNQFSKSPVAFSVYGWCLYKSGRLEDAGKMLSTSASAGQVSFDTAYFLAAVMAEKAKYEEAANLLRTALESPHGAFVYRPEAKALFLEVYKKLPEKKDEPKK